MRLGIFISILCCAVVLAARVTNGFIQISVRNLTGPQALTLRDRVRSYYQDNETCRAWAKWQNVEWRVTTNGGNSYDVSAQLVFLNTNVAERVYSNLVNRTTIPANVSGLISIHYCLIDPTNTAGWLGCNVEPEANYREKILNP